MAKYTAMNAEQDCFSEEFPKDVQDQKPIYTRLEELEAHCNRCPIKIGAIQLYAEETEAYRQNIKDITSVTHLMEEKLTTLATAITKNIKDITSVTHLMEEKLTTLTTAITNVVEKIDALGNRIKILEEKDFDLIDTNKDTMIDRNEWSVYAAKVNQMNADIIKNIQRNSLIGNAIMAVFLLVSAIVTIIQSH